jgi:putative colanic acid biosynthesis glycosyltransferase
MKILQINSVCGVGSTGRIVIEINKMIEEMNFNGLILYGRGNKREVNNYIKIGSDFDNKLHGVLTRLTDKHGFGSARETKNMIEILKNYDPDIIHLHNIHGYYLNIEVLFNYLKISAKPVLWTLHDCWSFTGHCSYFDYVVCNRWKTECYNCPQKNMYPSSKLIDNSKWNYKKKKELFTMLDNMTIITPSLWLREIVKESFLGKYDIKTIYNGINLDVFRPIANKQTIKIKEKYNCIGKFVILGVANIWEERKGLKYLLDLSKQLDDSFCVIIAGVNRKQKLALPKNVIGITKTNDVSQLVEIYSMADVFVNPTLEEVLGMTNIEALACGTPVITFNTGGSPECIDKTCGIVVEKGNLDRLTEAVIKIKNEPLSINACLNRAKLFDKDKKYKEYLELYKRTINKY